MSSGPVVGIVTSFDEQTRRYSVDPAYARAIEAAGGIPVILPYVQRADAVLALTDALVLHGGGDIDPVRYQDGPDSRAERVYAERDAFEFEIIRIADMQDTPILGICRGAQTLNVALGGTLYTDLTTDRPGVLDHRDASVPLEEFAHKVQIEEGSALAEIFGATAIDVNSSHHQAIREVATRLRAAAWSSDGVIEAVEAPSRRFAIGVQWHPERRWDLDPLGARLFEALIAAARRS